MRWSRLALLPSLEKPAYPDPDHGPVARRSSFSKPIDVFQEFTRPTRTEICRDSSVVFTSCRRRTPSSVNFPCVYCPISRPACLKAKKKRTHSQQVEGRASAICFRKVLAGDPRQRLRSYRRPPAAHSELSIVAVGFWSALVGRRKEAEQAVRLIAYTGGEVQPVAGSSGMVIAKAQRPQAVVLYRMTVGIAEQAIESAAGDVIDGDLAAPCVSYQQVIAEEAEISRRQCHPPGCIQPRTVLQSLQQLAFGRELVDESEAWEIEVVVLRGVLLGIGHIEVPVDILHVEGSKTLGNFAV